MRIAMTLLTCALAFSSTACKKKKDTTETSTGSAMGSAVGSAPDQAGSAAGSAEGSAVGSGADTGSAAMGTGAGSDMGSAAGSAADSTEMANKAGNCPSTVLGSVTKAAIKGKTVVLSITSADKDAILSIQRRTEELLKEKSEGPTGAAHDQKGTHGGGQGICPVYFGEGGTATSKKEAKGVAITITPKVKPEELKATIDERIAKASTWVNENVKPSDKGGAAGVGGGKGDHGGNHSGSGDSKGKERKEGGTGGGTGTGGGGSKGTGGGGAGSGDKKTGSGS